MKTIIGTIIGTMIVAMIGSISNYYGIPWGKNAISPVTIVIEKDPCNCFQTTCSMCLTKQRAGNDPVNQSPSVLSPHEQPVQTHSKSEDMMSEDMIRQKAKQSGGWYDPFWHQQIVNQQITNR